MSHRFTLLMVIVAVLAVAACSPPSVGVRPQNPPPVVETVVPPAPTSQNSVPTTTEGQDLTGWYVVELFDSHPEKCRSKGKIALVYDDGTCMSPVPVSREDLVKAGILTGSNEQFLADNPYWREWINGMCTKLAAKGDGSEKEYTLQPSDSTGPRLKCSDINPEWGGAPPVRPKPTQMPAVLWCAGDGELVPADLAQVDHGDKWAWYLMVKKEMSFEELMTLVPGVFRDPYAIAQLNPWLTIPIPACTEILLGYKSKSSQTSP